MEYRVQIQANDVCPSPPSVVAQI